MSINNKTELCDLFLKYKSDKCPQIFHSYSPVYHKFLEPYKTTIRSVIEIGIGNKPCMMATVGDQYTPGASLRAWKDFFIHSTIYGLDIDTSIFFNEHRIQCFYADQSSADSLTNTLDEIIKLNGKNMLNNKFDLIVDDGSHIKNHMILSFKTIFPFLNIGGLYIIEDIKRHELVDFINLANHDMAIKYIHYGESDWDDFIIYEKIG